jgi:hypothetical protein
VSFSSRDFPGKKRQKLSTFFAKNIGIFWGFPQKHVIPVCARQNGRFSTFPHQKSGHFGFLPLFLATFLATFLAKKCIFFTFSGLGPRWGTVFLGFPCWPRNHFLGGSGASPPLQKGGPGPPKRVRGGPKTRFFEKVQKMGGYSACRIGCTPRKSRFHAHRPGKKYSACRIGCTPPIGGSRNPSRRGVWRAFWRGSGAPFGGGGPLQRGGSPNWGGAWGGYPKGVPRTGDIYWSFGQNDHRVSHILVWLWRNKASPLLFIVPSNSFAYCSKCAAEFSVKNEWCYCRSGARRSTAHRSHDSQVCPVTTY